jgi:hypothetical protein
MHESGISPLPIPHSLLPTFKPEGSPNEKIFTAKHESGISSTPYSPLLTPHFQVSPSWEKPTTKYENMILLGMVLQQRLSFNSAV